MPELFSRLTALPGYGIAGLLILVLYAIQSEIRFGRRARTHRAGMTDRLTTVVVSASSAIPVVGFVVAMKAKVAALGVPYAEYRRQVPALLPRPLRMLHNQGGGAFLKHLIVTSRTTMYLAGSS